jgi:hypothetical protein
VQSHRSDTFLDAARSRERHPQAEGRALEDHVTTLRRSLVATTLVVGVLVACQPAGRTFQVTLQDASGDPLPVSLADRTGIVTGISQEAGFTVSIEPVVRADPGEPRALVLVWLGGACDASVTVNVVKQEGSYVIGLASHERTGGCTLAGTPRAIRITTSEPLPIDSIIVTGR